MTEQCGEDARFRRLERRLPLLLVAQHEAEQSDVDFAQKPRVFGRTEGAAEVFEAERRQFEQRVDGAAEFVDLTRGTSNEMMQWNRRELTSRASIKHAPSSGKSADESGNANTRTVDFFLRGICAD